MITGSGAAGATGETGSAAADSAFVNSAADGSSDDGTTLSEPETIGSVLLISIEGLESEDAGLIGSVSMASAARCGLLKLKGVVTCRFEDAVKADVLLSPSRDKMSKGK